MKLAALILGAAVGVGVGISLYVVRLLSTEERGDRDYAHVRDDHGLPIVGEWSAGQLADTHETLHRRLTSASGERVGPVTMGDDDATIRRPFDWGDDIYAGLDSLRGDMSGAT